MWLFTIKGIFCAGSSGIHTQSSDIMIWRLVHSVILQYLQQTECYAASVCFFAPYIQLFQTSYAVALLHFFPHYHYYYYYLLTLKLVRPPRLCPPWFVLNFLHKFHSRMKSRPRYQYLVPWIVRFFLVRGCWFIVVPRSGEQPREKMAQVQSTLYWLICKVEHDSHRHVCEMKKEHACNNIVNLWFT